MHDIRPANRSGQVFVGALAKLDRLTCQHRLETGLTGKVFCLLEADPDFEIRFISNRGGDGEDESFNAAVCALARTNEK